MFKTTQNPVIEVKMRGGGLLTIRKDAIETVETVSVGGRNLQCTINGIETEAGYDFVLDALGWTPEKIP